MEPTSEVVSTALNSSQIAIICLGILLGITVIILIILSRKVLKLSNQVFSLQRNVDHKNTVLENALSQLAKDLPLDAHPHTHMNHIHSTIENLLNKFSIRLNKKIHDKFTLEQNIWHDKFSILLSILGKTEKDLKVKRDDIFKESWTSITELRQKSQLLFNDMQEDGIFYRMQSLWLLGTVYLEQQNYFEAFRLCNAALRLAHDSPPKLPLSYKILWNIGELFLNCEKHLDKHSQHKTLEKFQLTPSTVIELYQNLESFESNIEILQQIRIWYNHHSHL